MVEPGTRWRTQRTRCALAFVGFCVRGQVWTLFIVQAPGVVASLLGLRCLGRTLGSEVRAEVFLATALAGIMVCSLVSIHSPEPANSHSAVRPGLQRGLQRKPRTAWHVPRAVVGSGLAKSREACIRNGLRCSARLILSARRGYWAVFRRCKGHHCWQSSELSDGHRLRQSMFGNTMGADSAFFPCFQSVQVLSLVECLVGFERCSQSRDRNFCLRDVPENMA